jgi:hypothetical protein
MKHALKIAVSIFATLAFSTAFATKARSRALGNSFHITGTQTIFASPYHTMSQDNFVAIESGLTTSTTVDNGAEGSILTNINPDSKLFFSLGHIDEQTQNQRRFINGLVGVTAYKTQQNPVEFIYGWKDGSTVWAVGAYYSNFHNKVSGEKESSNGVRLAASYGDFKWKTNIGLTNSAVNTAGDQLNNNTYMNIGLRYSQNKLRYGFDVTVWDASQTLNAATDPNESHSFQNVNFRVTEVNKIDGGDFFYGITLDQANVKNKMTDKKFSRLTAPFIMGAEIKATDWLVVRSSIVQTVLVAQSKDEAGYPEPALAGGTGIVGAEFAAESNNTIAAAGVGLIFNKVQLDATLTGLMGSAANQKIDGTDLFSQVSAVYKF